MDAQRDAVERVAGLTDDDLAAVVGFAARTPSEAGKAVQNAVAFCRGGQGVDTTETRLLPTYDVFDEARYFDAAARQPVHSLAPLSALGGNSEDDSDADHGDAGDGDADNSDAGAIDVGVSICEDVWNEPDMWEPPRYDADPIEAGADLLVNC